MRFKSIGNLFTDIKTIPHQLDQKLYPSLNGLRGISILMVVIYHFAVRYYDHFPQIEFFGALGVNVFFVISGFLITTLCIKEKVLTSTISLRDFYIRRVFRIIPVAWLYLLVMVIINYFFQLHLAPANFLAALFFVSNISFFNQVQYDWSLSHYWSLSTEEQFYLIFPVFIKKAFGIFVAMILFIAVVIPCILYLQTLIPALNIKIFTFALRYLLKFQGISVGCLFSVLLFKGYLSFGKYGFIVSIISLLLIAYLKFDPEQTLRAAFLNLTVSVLIGIVIVNNIVPSASLLYQFLNLKGLSWIGILSYSIYIWQQLFLSNDARFPVSLLPINLLFLVVVPVLSYFTFEKYFLRFKKKFSHLKK